MLHLHQRSCFTWWNDSRGSSHRRHLSIIQFVAIPLNAVLSACSHYDSFVRTRNNLPDTIRQTSFCRNFILIGIFEIFFRRVHPNGLRNKMKSRRRERKAQSNSISTEQRTKHEWMKNAMHVVFANWVRTRWKALHEKILSGNFSTSIYGPTDSLAALSCPISQLRQRVWRDLRQIFSEFICTFRDVLILKMWNDLQMKSAGAALFQLIDFEWYWIEL